MIDKLIQDVVTPTDKVAKGRRNVISPFSPAPVESQLYYRRKRAAPVIQLDIARA